LICGNGGSAADAEHWGRELLKGFCKPRHLSHEDRERLPLELGERLQGGLPIIPLTGFPALSTAFANDVEPELTFAQLTWALGREGDVLIGMSTSGNARNVCLPRGRRAGGDVYNRSNRGKRRNIEVSLRSDNSRSFTGDLPCAGASLPVYHCLSLMLEDEFFSG